MPVTEQPAFETLTDHCSQLGEGPVWDARARAICWVDITSGHIHEFGLSDQNHRTRDMGEIVGAVALSETGDYLAALQSGLARIDRQTGARTPLSHPEEARPENRYNDGKCDPAGRFWVGTMALDERPRTGNLYMLNRDCTTELKVKGVSISNGLAWSADRRTLYYIDSPTRQVQAFDYDLETGGLSNRRVAFAIPEAEGTPDGMTIDREGMLWIAHWDGWQVARWNPATGEKLLGWRLPAARITSCTFGGDGLNDLYVTSARVGLSEMDLAKQPQAGAVFVFKDIGFRGLEPDRWLAPNQKIKD